MSIIQKVENYVTSQLTENLSSAYLYHNLSHTRRVVKYVKELIEGEKVSTKNAQILEMAAWFHDIGFIKGHENHEQKSAEIAKSFLEKEKIAQATIDKIEALILVTTMTEEPKDLFEKIILDADCGHLGKKSYYEVSELLREEWAQLGLKEVSEIDWIEENINNHHNNCPNEVY